MTADARVDRGAARVDAVRIMAGHTIEALPALKCLRAHGQAGVDGAQASEGEAKAHAMSAGMEAGDLAVVAGRAQALAGMLHEPAGDDVATVAADRLPSVGAGAPGGDQPRRRFQSCRRGGETQRRGALRRWRVAALGYPEVRQQRRLVAMTGEIGAIDEGVVVIVVAAGVAAACRRESLMIGPAPSVEIVAEQAGLPRRGHSARRDLVLAVASDAVRRVDPLEVGGPAWILEQRRRMSVVRQLRAMAGHAAPVGDGLERSMTGAACLLEDMMAIRGDAGQEEAAVAADEDRSQAHGQRRHDTQHLRPRMASSQPRTSPYYVLTNDIL